MKDVARKRNPLRDEAYRIWLESNKQKPLKDIAEELGVTASTVRKWKSEDKWDGETKRSAPNEKERYDSMKGNQNAKGNPGNSNASPPPNNQNALSHGLFSKIIPDETRQLMAELYTSEPTDIIWNNIMIQYSAIVRAQKIMFVRDELDTTEWEKKRKGKWVPDENGNPIFVPNEIEKEIQFAWDKQANFMNAQSRAMGTLSNLIKQFISIADESDERRKKLELMDAQITNLRAKAREDDEPDEVEDDGFLAALESEGEELWPEE
ncbi:MAG: phage terminase small subunit [Enterococcus italicus]